MTRSWPPTSPSSTTRAGPATCGPPGEPVIAPPSCTRRTAGRSQSGGSGSRARPRRGAARSAPGARARPRRVGSRVVSILRYRQHSCGNTLQGSAQAPGWLPSRPPGAEDRRRRETGTAMSERNGRSDRTAGLVEALREGREAARRSGPPPGGGGPDAYVETVGTEEPKAALFQTVDPAARRGRGAAALHVLPHVPGDGDHGVPVERGDAGARAADRGSPPRAPGGTRWSSFFWTPQPQRRDTTAAIPGDTRLWSAPLKRTVRVDAPPRLANAGPTGVPGLRPRPRPRPRAPRRRPPIPAAIARPAGGAVALPPKLRSGASASSSPFSGR